MSAPGQDPIVPEDVDRVREALLRAIRVAAENAATAQDTREMKEGAGAARDFADAWVVLDPALDQAGVPLGHELEMELVRQDGQARLEEARSRAAAPASQRRRLRVKRDGSGRMSEIEED